MVLIIWLTALSFFANKKCKHLNSGKGTEESTLGKDSSVPLMPHDPRHLELICLEKKRKSVFGFKNPILDFLKATHPYFWVTHASEKRVSEHSDSAWRSLVLGAVWPCACVCASQKRACSQAMDNAIDRMNWTSGRGVKVGTDRC